MPDSFHGSSRSSVKAATEMLILETGGGPSPFQVEEFISALQRINGNGDLWMS